jgi:hypothetical protein
MLAELRGSDDPTLDDGSDLSHVREDKDARQYTSMFHLNQELKGRRRARDLDGWRAVVYREGCR